MRDTSDIFFSISGSLLYPSFYLLWMWLLSMLWCGLTITHFSISSPSTIFIFYFIPPFHPTSFDLILLSFCFMFDLGLVHTHHTCSFDVTIHLSSLFVWGPLGPGLMTFSTHCISCMRGMGIISLGSLSLVSFHFFHHITLAYVTSRVWRPPWGRDFTHCAWRLTHGQYSRLVGDYSLEHDGWGVEMAIYTGAYPSY